MDADAAMDASSLCSIYQPLDVLRLELQNEPAYAESSMPKDDHTLTYVFVPSVPLSSFRVIIIVYPTHTHIIRPFHAASFFPAHAPHTLGIGRRFLKARGYNASHAKQMVLDCIQWRRTVEDVGIEELYRRIDPFDVRSALLYPLTPTCPLPAPFPRDLCEHVPDFLSFSFIVQFPGREDIFESWPMGFHKVRTHLVHAPPGANPHTHLTSISLSSLFFRPTR